MSLLDRFRSGSELDSVGHFTLDEKRAKNKMARFQLVRQEDFLLLVVQAAVAAGCSSISVTAKPHLIELRASGVRLESEKVQKLEDFLFDTRPEMVSYYLLGVARNAVTPFCTEDPDIRVEGDELTLSAALKEPFPNLYSHLRNHLTYCPCEVTVNDKSLSRIPLTGDRMVTLNDGEFSILTLIRHGVMVGNKHLEFKINFRAVVADSRFKVDASFFDVVEDELYHEALTTVRLQAHELLAELARTYTPGDPDRTKLLELLCQVLPDPVGVALRECPLFVLADRSETVSLNSLSSQLGQAGLLYSNHRLNLQLDAPVVLLDTNILWSILQELFPGQLKDANAAYRRKLERLQHIQLWERSPRDTKLGPATYLATEKVDGPDWQAEIGFLGPPGGESHIDMLFQGRLLCSERLDDVPPGATAVINFKDVEINESWTRPQGRRFRTILTTLKSWLERLFEDMELSERQLYPALLNYLEDCFRRQHTPLPSVAMKVPLFVTLDRRVLSFEQVKALPRVALGERVSYSDRLPGHLLPDNMLHYTSRAYELLVARLGRAQVEDLRNLQDRLTEIDRQLGNPLPAILDVQVDRSEKLDREDLKGEMGLIYERSGPSVRVVLMYRGAKLDEDVVKMTKIFRAEIVVELDRLRPNDDWSGIERDKTYKKLFDWLRTKIRELEKSALDCPKLPPTRFLPLLKAYSASIEDHRDKKIFQSSTPGRYHSLAEIQEEIQEHGDLLRAPMGVALVDRLVLLEASLNRGIREGLLLEVLGNFKWGDARKVAESRRLEADFQSRPVVSDISPSYRTKFRFSLSSCTGEVLVGDGLTDRFVDCYYGGRFVCRKVSVLPRGCAAAIDSPNLTLSKDFNDAQIPSSLLEEMMALCEQGLLKCAIDTDEPALRGKAFFHALSDDASESFHTAFDELPVFMLQGGGWISVKELKDKDTSPGYVQHTFPKQIKPDRLILRAGKQARTLIQKKTKHVPYKTEARLLNVENDRKYLNNLSVEIPPRFTFRRSYTSAEGLRAELALMPAESQLLGLDQEGKPQGFFTMRSLPVRAVVGPTSKGRRDDDKRPTSKLTKTEMKWLKDRIDDLYLDWVADLSHKPINETDRKDALRILSLTKHELGSQQEHPQAFLAQQIWKLPLFGCVDGTLVSGEALTDRLGTDDGPLIICNERWRAPAHYPLLVEDSVEHNLLVSVFGRKSLQWYEAPPLVDTDQIKSNIQSLVSWGVMPFKLVQKKLEGLAESLESKVSEKTEEPLDSEPPKKKTKKRKKKKKAPKPPPEAVFLEKMKVEARALLGRKAYHGSDQYFRETVIGTWILGPPVYLSNGICYLNASHAGVRWLINFDPDSNSKQYRVGRVLLLVLWVGLVNVDSAELTDAQEHEFLQDLLEKMIQTFGS
jgi:hypothetical protein